MVIEVPCRSQGRELFDVIPWGTVVTVKIPYRTNLNNWPAGLLGSALAFQPRRHRHLYISLCHCPPPTISFLLSCIHLRTSTPPTTCTIPSSSLPSRPLLRLFPSDTSSSRPCATLSRLDVISDSQGPRQRQEKRFNLPRQRSLLRLGPVHLGSAVSLLGTVPSHQANVSFTGPEPQFLCRTCGDTSRQRFLESKVPLPLDGRYCGVYSNI